MYWIPLIDLAWVFHWFCARVFVLCLAIKRERNLILRNIWYQIYLGNICYSFGKINSLRKFVKDHVFSGLKIYLGKLECANIGYIRVTNGRLLHLSKWRKKLFTLMEMCEKIQKSMNCRKKLTSSLRDFNNPYLEDDLTNLHLWEECP